MSMSCPTAKPAIEPSIEKLLLSLSAKPLTPTKYVIDLATWLKQRETIESTMKAVGPRRRPLLLVEASCPICRTIFQREQYELRKRFAKNPNYSPVCCLSCATRQKNLLEGKRSVCACNNCGKEMWDNPQKNHACSDECRKEIHRKRGLKIRTVPERNCVICGAAYRPATNAYESKCCSMKCKNDLHAMEMKEANNPGWKGGISSGRAKNKVQRDFRLAKRHAQMMDADMCVACNSPDNLHGHHINHNPLDNRFVNLVTLCQSCHSLHHAMEKSNRKLVLFPWLSKYATMRESLSTT